MYGPKLGQWIAENKPASVTIDHDEVWAWMLAHGAQIVTPMRKTLFGRKPERKVIEYCGKTFPLDAHFQVSITWGDRVKGNEVFFAIYAALYIQREPGERFDWISSVDAAQFGYTPKTVALPEPVVEMPVPDWCGASSYDGYTEAGVTSQTVFESEYDALFDDFVMKARQNRS
jgi:hypothetical protein